MRTPVQSELVKKYKKNGYTRTFYFPDEYILMMDLAFNKVRVYEDGHVLEADPDTGEYVKVRDKGET